MRRRHESCSRLKAVSCGSERGQSPLHWAGLHDQRRPSTRWHRSTLRIAQPQRTSVGQGVTSRVWSKDDADQNGTSSVSAMHLR